ncbi:hypothetical protein BLL42_12935 [Pseudomonas frederiksbergensis]|uniref:Winged helix-turn-helix transcriptional regulator n=1 Tax=Pseudomonas frederiksbergensis TaxID=104087 RepID=A0A1J0EKD1_9PSED|nr:winged helix-turn-helix transcriptional regulator [Pseudomonas frederiksbergensis]APC16589.1 hypothetical protein BLL42_12935 [Pseudomonas frederiksbergensis]
MLTFRADPAQLVEAFGDAARPLFADKSLTTQETTQKTVQGQIVAVLRQQPTTTRRELAKQLGLSPDGVKYHLDKLRAAGVIRHVGPTKSGHWEVLK